MLKMNKQTIILLILGIFFIFIYSYLSFITPLRFNSPDETASYFWSERLSSGQNLKISEPLNLLADSAVHLRSDKVNAKGEIVPGSFLGLIIIYGFLAKTFTPLAIKFFTPVIAAIASWCFYGLTKKWFSEKVALIATVLLLINPAWWYYAERGLIPNVLFVSLLLIGCWFVWRKCETGNEKWILGNYLLGGLFVGLALTVRTSEIVWLLPVGLALLIIYREKINWSGVVLFMAAILLTFIPIFGLNKDLYGSYFTTGYGLKTVSQSLAAPAASETLLAPAPNFNNLVLPFGFHPYNVLKNIWFYYFQIMWWYFIPLVIGFVWYLISAIRRPKDDSQQLIANKRVYLGIFIFVTAWLLIYYGSWNVKDNISGHVTIGTSYLRYWLPAFILGLPLAALAIAKALDFFKQKFSKVLVGIFIFGLFLVLSTNLVISSEEGLLSTVSSINQYEKINQAAKAKLYSTAIIISDRGDKIFWPQWRVATFTGDFTVFQSLGKVIDKDPVYYYSFNRLPAADLDKLNQEIANFGLFLGQDVSLNGEDMMYALRFKNLKPAVKNGVTN